MKCFAAALGFYQLTQGAGEFRWILYESGNFFVGSMCRSLIKTKVLADNNNKIS
jgi:hypothetical protein